MHLSQSGDFWFRVGTSCYFILRSCGRQIANSPDHRFDFSDPALLFSPLLKSWASAVAASKSTSLLDLSVIFSFDSDHLWRGMMSFMFHHCGGKKHYPSGRLVGFSPINIFPVADRDILYISVFAAPVPLSL